MSIADDSRPIITLVDSGVTAEIDPKVLEKEQGDYEIGRAVSGLKSMMVRPSNFFLIHR